MEDQSPRSPYQTFVHPQNTSHMIGFLLYYCQLQSLEQRGRKIYPREVCPRYTLHQPDNQNDKLIRAYCQENTRFKQKRRNQGSGKKSQ